MFSVLKIHFDDKITGSMSGGDIGVDENGDLNSAQPTGNQFPILHARIE